MIKRRRIYMWRAGLVMGSLSAVCYGPSA